jgi:hypothetical protein
MTSLCAAACVLTAALPCSAQDADGRNPREPRERRTPVLALDALGGLTNSTFASEMVGARAQLSFPWQDSFALGGAVTLQDQYFSWSGSSTTQSGSSDGPHRERVGAVYSGGFVLSYGAPVTSGFWGLALEMGMAGGSRKAGAAHAGSTGTDTAPDTFFSPYGQASVVLQIPLWKSVRPYAALSGRQTFDAFGESNQTAMLSLGIAFDPF